MCEIAPSRNIRGPAIGNYIHVLYQPHIHAICEGCTYSYIVQMRHLYLVIDMSKAMEEADLKPTRIICTSKVKQLVLIH